jgi:hypothetical protein
MLLLLALFANTLRASDPPTFNLVYILAPDPIAAEGGGDTATFLVVRDGPTDAALAVNYHVIGDAQNGMDFAALSGTVTIPAGERRAALTVDPVDDTLVEGIEAFAILLDQPFVWPPPYLVFWPSFAVGHIEDNDFPPTNRPPLVRMVNPPDGSVFLAPVDITLVAHANDLDGRVRTVEFFDGTNSLGIVSNRPPVVRPVLDAEIADLDLDLEAELDAIPELDDLGPVIRPVPNVFRLRWEDVPPGGHVLTAVATDDDGASTRSDPVHIRVHEPPPEPIVNVRATDPVATEPGPLDARLDTATFVVWRSGAANLPLTVFYRLGGTASNGIDYAELPHSVVIPAGERKAEVVVEPLDDALVEGPEKVVLSLVEPPGCLEPLSPTPSPIPLPGCYTVGRYHSARAVINDNDPANRPPLVRLVRPLDGSVFLAPADIGLVAQARDLDGRVVFVEFFEGTNSLGVVSNRFHTLTSNAPAYALKWTNVPPGRYELHAEATDDDGAVARSRPVEIKVVEPIDPPIVNIEARDAEAAEVLPPGTPNPAVFVVSRDGDNTRPLLVHYRVGGSALNGVDYPLLSGRVLIPAGADETNIVVTPIDDRLVEGLETVGLKLLPSLCAVDAINSADILSPVPHNVARCYRVGTNGSARAVIRDNDVSPTNHPPRVAIVRPEDGDVFPAHQPIGLVAEARDADGVVRSVEFFDGTNSLGIVSNSLSVATPGDVSVNVLPSQFFRLVWADPSPGVHVLTAVATDNRGASSRSDPVRIKVVEIIRPPVVVIEAADPYASEGDLLVKPWPVSIGHEASLKVIALEPRANLPDNAVFVVKRDRRTNDDLTVFYKLGGTASNGVDYRLLSGAVVIPRGAWAARIVVDPIDDRLVEGTETVVAALEDVVCPAIYPPPPGCYRVGEPSRAVAFIRDNDSVPPNRPPRVAIVRPASGDRFREGSDIPIVAQALDPDGYVPRVEFYADNRLIGVDERIFIVEPPPGQLQRFSIIWSNVPDGHFVLTAKATDNRGAMTWSPPVRIEVMPTNPPVIVGIVATDAVAREGTPPDNIAVFRIRRSGPTNAPLTVHYSIHGTASNTVDYLNIGTQVTIPAGRRGVRILVVPIDDRRPEGRETVVLRLEDRPAYTVGRFRRAGALILDNDHPPLCTDRTPDGLFHFCQPVPRDTCVRLEGSVDLVAWEPLVDLVVETDDGLTFVDPETEEHRARFFRVVPMVDVEFDDTDDE